MPQIRRHAAVLLVERGAERAEPFAEVCPLHRVLVRGVVPHVLLFGEVAGIDLLEPIRHRTIIGHARRRGVVRLGALYLLGLDGIPSLDHVAQFRDAFTETRISNHAVRGLLLLQFMQVGNRVLAGIPLFAHLAALGLAGLRLGQCPPLSQLFAPRCISLGLLRLRLRPAFERVIEGLHGLRRVAVLEPVLQGRGVHFGEAADPGIAAPVREAVTVKPQGRAARGGAGDDLVFIELAGAGVHLIHDQDVIRIRHVAHVEIDVIAVRAFRAPEIAVIGRHGDGPLRAIRAGAAPLGPFGRLNGQVQPVPAGVALAIVPRLFLRLGRRRVGLGRRLGDGVLACRGDDFANCRLVGNCRIFRAGNCPDTQGLFHLALMLAREDPAACAGIVLDRHAIDGRRLGLVPAAQDRGLFADRLDRQGGGRFRR